MLIREATSDDWPAIWPFLHRIVRAGDTYCYDPAIGDAEARSSWLPGPPWHTFVALVADTVVGSAKVGPNQAGPGSHVANASFMVDPDRAGAGIGRTLGEHVLDWAARAGYSGMQFNAVVELNHAAVSLWESLGFEILTTIPGAFRHPTEGFVGLHIMYRALAT